MRYFKLGFLSVSFLIYSLVVCSNVVAQAISIKSGESADFGELHVAKAIPAASLSEAVNMPGGVYSTGNYLVLMDAAVNDGMVVLYDIKADSVVARFGKRGSGPLEFLGIPESSIYNPMDATVLELYDWGSKKLLGLTLHSIIEGGALEKAYEYVIPPQLVNAQYAGFAGNEQLYAYGTLSEGVFALFDLQSEKAQYFPFIPEPDSRFTTQDRSWYYSSKAVINPELGRVAVAMSRFNQLLIYDMEGNAQVAVRSKRFEPRHSSDRNTPYYYTYIEATSDYIFTVWLGFDERNMERNIRRGRMPSSEIRVFDWDGNPVKRISLAGSFISMFTIDEHNQRIIAINEFDEEQPLGVYDISGILKSN